jgi:hypothetical protein
MKVAALQIEVSTDDYVFTPGIKGNEALLEISDQKSKFSNNLNRYEAIVRKYFPDERHLSDPIQNTGNLFIREADKLVKIKQMCLLQLHFQIRWFSRF